MAQTKLSTSKGQINGYAVAAYHNSDLNAKMITNSEFESKYYRYHFCIEDRFVKSVNGTGFQLSADNFICFLVGITNLNIFLIFFLL